MITINGTTLTTTSFPDNTTQVWQLPKEAFESKAAVEWVFANEGEFLHLAQLKALLDHHGISAVLTITYLPYGRQDKEVNNALTFALRPFARLLNSLAFEEVTIVDPHSKVALDLINNSRAVYPVAEVSKVFCDVADLVCYPDAGARTKYQEIYPELPFIYGEKVRNQTTGMIAAYKLVGNPAGKRVLIVDDICDGGATFNLLAKELLKAGATSVSLFVTHGLFSKGTRTLFDSGISRVFTKQQEVGRRYRYEQF